MRTGITFEVTTSDRAQLEAIVADRNRPQKHVWRANIILLTISGCGTAEIMRRTGKAKTCVWRWQERYMREGVNGLLKDKTQPSRKPPLSKVTVARVVELTLGPPPGETTHWTACAMAKVCGISASSVQRIWRSHGLQPHRFRQFKLSKGLKFVEKLQDIVGLYMAPPAHALVLSIEQKNPNPGSGPHPARLADEEGPLGDHDARLQTARYHHAVSAFNVLDGTVTGQNMQRHRHQEFIRFLNAIEAKGTAGKVIHAIVNNYAAHKHPKVLAWLKPHPPWVFHFTPTSCSWLNAVEGFFAKLAKRRLKRGVFRSVTDLQAAINRFLEESNREPKPFVWTKDPDQIIAAVKRGHQALDSIH